MTLTDLHHRLSAFDADLPLVFATADGAVSGGYHVTEFRHSVVTGIDCGANVSHYVESSIDLLDGAGGAHMSVGKFRAILGQSLDAVPGLGDGPVRVEYAPGNVARRIYDIAEPAAYGDAVLLALSDGRVTCKPMEAAVAGLREAAGGACGPNCC